MAVGVLVTGAYRRTPEYIHSSKETARSSVPVAVLRHAQLDVRGPERAGIGQGRAAMFTGANFEVAPVFQIRTDAGFQAVGGHLHLDARQQTSRRDGRRLAGGGRGVVRFLPWDSERPIRFWCSHLRVASARPRW